MSLTVERGTEIPLGETLADALKKAGAEAKAQIVRGVILDHGEDLVLSIPSEGAPIVLTPETTLTRAADKLRGNRENPEALSDFLDSYWKNFAANLVRSGRSLPLSDLQVVTSPYTEQDLYNLRQQPDAEMGFFLPEILADKTGLPILKAGHPEMSIYVEDGGEYTHQSFGWMSVQSSLFTPHPNTTQKEAETIFKGNNRLGFTPNIFIAFSGVTKEVEGRFINEKSVSRLLGYLIRGGAAGAGFNDHGYCGVVFGWDPKDRVRNLGARSLGVKS